MKLADELDEKFATTHIGVLTRSDGGTFSPAEALDVLQGWQLAMSFALGRWVAPALPVGTDENGVSAWEMWAPWRCDGLAGAPSAWWDDHTADDLATFVDLFLQHWLDPTRRVVVRHVAQHALAANHSGTTLEARILIAQAGLEYLGWVTLVLEGGMTRSVYKKLRAAERLRMLLRVAGIPMSVPQDLSSISGLIEP